MYLFPDTLTSFFAHVVTILQCFGEDTMVQVRHFKAVESIKRNKTQKTEYQSYFLFSVGFSNAPYVLHFGEIYTDKKEEI